MTYKTKHLLYSVLFLTIITACNQSTREANNNHNKADSLFAPQNIHKIVGIGKVVPQKGMVDLASETGGIVRSVYKESGDSVHQGEAIIVLKQKADFLKIQELKDQIATQKQQVAANKISSKQFLTQLESKEKNLAISKKLLKTGAETREQVADLQTEKEVLKVKVEKSQKEVHLSQSKVRELQSKLASAENQLNDKTIKAPSDGIILNIDAKVGSAIQALQSFATYAPNGAWIIHGEADEMFANQLAIGQKVGIHYIGNNHIITTGKIIALSPDLSNKSIFTDEPGEQQDRRVRRFKVLLDSKDHLLLNSKVECNIHIKN